MTILTDVDGVLLDWDYHFTQWMIKKGYTLYDPKAYELEKRFGLNSNLVFDLCKTYNESAEIGFHDAYKDSIKYTWKIHQETGCNFTCISSLSANKAAQQLRVLNLKRVFGEIFDDFIFLPCGAYKSDVLEQFAYRDLWWIEDKPENAHVGHIKGLKCILMNHPYNISVQVNPSITRVNNWSEIYSLICK